MLNIFKELNNYNQYFENQIILSSTLLGLLIATSTFILQSGFTNFTFSRSMFLKYYIKQSKFLFLSLAYNIFLSVLILYVNYNLPFYFHILFSILFIKYILDFYCHKGYIITINSNKFNSFENRFLKYLRYIQNGGFVNLITICVLIFFICIYPLLNSKFGIFTEKQGFISTIICFVFCVLILIQIIPEYFSFTELEYKHKEKNEIINNIKTDVLKENDILKDILIKNGRHELKQKTLFKYSEGSIEVYMPKNKNESFFVINLYLKSSNIYEVIDSIEHYSYDFFKELTSISIDINSFVLSFFIHLEGIDDSKKYFIRAKRIELESILSQTTKPKEFISLINNKLIDDLFRGI